MFRVIYRNLSNTSMYSISKFITFVKTGLGQLLATATMYLSSSHYSMHANVF